MLPKIVPATHIFTLTMIAYLTVCSCHVTYAFQSESTLYSCLNVKELLARRRCEIWSWSDCNWTRTHNHLIRKRTLNHLAKLALNDWAVLWVIICTVYLVVCSWPVWLNGWVFYELSGCGFESSCSHMNYLKKFVGIKSLNRKQCPGGLSPTIIPAPSGFPPFYKGDEG